ncbi:ribosomal protection-like ABC-F family protein [Ligilactobacillus sp. LYQ139]|uniref:ribosomal protection-like ABC-F family protein n=1 Tax=Ligilactobacillus sp. LYQ139 TaxID=3378800 RepID=UPI003851DB9C
MGSIGIKRLSFKYDDQDEPLFDNVNLNLDSSWRLGLIGRNGRGKTTFLNLLRGNLDYKGKIDHKQAFTYYPHKVRDVDNYTLYALQQVSQFEEWQLERELNLMGVDLDLLWKPFKKLSGGEKAKILLALCFIESDSFPLLDEPTNHLDGKGRQEVAQYLLKKSGFILVSHDSQVLNTVCDHILSIENKNIYLYRGNYKIFKAEKKRRDEKNVKDNIQIKKEIGTLTNSLNQKKQWGNKREKEKNKRKDNAKKDKGFEGARSARLMKKMNNMKKAVDHKIQDKKGLLNDVEFMDKLSLNFSPTRKEKLLRLQDFSLSYGNDKLFVPISFELKRNDCIALVGENGVGKTSLINAILGDFKGEIVGSLHKAKDLKISVVRQEFNYRGSLKDFAQTNRINFNVFLNNLHKLGFKRRMFNKRIEHMSSGQQKRVALAKSLTENAELYIWDEPLNYLDVYNKQQLQDMILEFSPTMLLIDHDVDFINKIAGKKIELKNS